MFLPLLHSSKMTLLVLTLFSLLAFTSAKISSTIGINYGQMGTNLPSAQRSIELIRSMKAGRVKLYNADREVLNHLAGTNIQASIMVSNQEITGLASNQTRADEWVKENVVPFYPRTQIRFLLVGNEVLSYFSASDRQTWIDLVPAMRRIKKSLKKNHIQKIKVGTPLAMDALENTFPPSSGRFRPDIVDPVMRPLLEFLTRTESYFFLDVYPYFPWASNPAQISLDYALFSGNQTYTDPGSALRYTNLFDQMLDSVVFAMSNLGYRNIQIAVSETGWPNAGDIDQPGANVRNAEIYNKNLIKKMTGKPPRGTPARPGVVIPTFIFSLYNEDLKGGPSTERHWGLLDFKGEPIYKLDLAGGWSESSNRSRSLKPKNSRPHKGKIWCVAARGANSTELKREVARLCSQGHDTCEALRPGKDCYEPGSVARHASYAFSSYWAQFRRNGVACHFNGLGVQTTKDPSHGSCKFPSLKL